MTAPTLSREEIEAIDRLEKAATAGPWRVEADVRQQWNRHTHEYEGPEYIAGYNIEAPDGDVIGIEGITSEDDTDAQLIAALRNAWPSIKAEIEAGRAGAERVQVMTEALKRIAAHSYGLQGLLEDGAPPADGAPVAPTLQQIEAVLSRRIALRKQAEFPADTDAAVLEMAIDITRLFGLPIPKIAGPGPEAAQPAPTCEYCGDRGYTYVRTEGFGTERKACPDCRPAAPAQVGAQPAGRVEAFVPQQLPMPKYRYQQDGDGASPAPSGDGEEPTL